VTDLDCSELVELVTAYLDRSVDAETQKRVVDHLALCDGCQQYVDQFRQTIRVLGELPPERLTDDARAGLLDTFRDWRR
jgi:predicted anti-sigma-YlaC factor YlaD